MAETDDGLNDSPVHRVFRNSRDEATVDFHRIEGKLMEEVDR